MPGEGFLACYSGSSAGHQDDSTVVFLDGAVDNIDRLGGVYSVPCPGDASPSEVIGRLFRLRGLQVIREFEGSFALVVVEPAIPAVHLARDRLGARPLYFARLGSGWCWGSELKCLLPLLGGGAKVDRTALSEAIHYRWLLGEHSLVEGVNQVLPASVVTLRPDHPSTEERLPALSFAPSNTGSFSSWREETNAALSSFLTRQSARHPRAAILLSGGVDSSLVAAKAREAGFDSLVALSARFPELPNPELEWAVRVARHLGIEHRIVDVPDSYLREFFPYLVWRSECPPRHFQSFALAALLSEASRGAHVVLDGNGADALFGTRGMVLAQRQAVFDRVPAGWRRNLGRLIQETADGYLGALRTHLTNTLESWVLHDDAIRYSTPPSRVVPAITPYPRPDPTIVERFYPGIEAPPLESFQVFHTHTIIRNHLEKMDRISSPLGVEVLTPFLSPEVMSVAVRLPSRFKAGRMGVKPILKSLAASFYPRDWIYRPKAAFPVPIRDWLLGALEPHLAILREERTVSRGIFDASALSSLDPRSDFQLLRTCASLELFLRQFMDGDSVVED